MQLERVLTKVMQDIRLKTIQAGLVDQNTKWLPQSGGRSNQVWRVGDRIVKEFSTHQENPLFPNSGKAELSCLKSLQGLDLCAKYIGSVFDDEVIVLVYSYLEGHLWSHDTTAVAKILQKLRNAHLPKGLRRGPIGAEDLVKDGMACLKNVPTSMANHLKERLPSIQTEFELEPVLAHGDVVPANIIETKQGLRLIDWQCPAIACPTYDIATFLSPAMQTAYGKEPLTSLQVDLFLNQTDDGIVKRYHQLAPLYHWRMACYCAWRIATGFDEYKKPMILEMRCLGEEIQL